MSSDNKNNDQGIDPDRIFWQNTASYNGNSKILLVTIVAFSIIILIVFAYHLYQRFILRRHRSTFQGHSFTVVTQPLQRGLDKSAIASLPIFVVGVGSHEVLATECAVCLALLEEKDTVRMLPNCNHVFHVTCVDTWLTTCYTCPICRTKVEPSQTLEPEPREGPIGDGASSSDYKSSGSTVLRLDSFRRILTRERSSDRHNHSPTDQDRVLDLERH
ncbi:RING-H2 finger protein ATL40 [Hirschfeldia incana]|nr:RING-H2 finger protein ATL40 [Hirschfeldia incana]